jgi:hypothetical protein
MPTNDAETPEAPAGNEQAGLIPATFQLGGIQWVVRNSEDLLDVIGCCQRDAATIVLSSKVPEQIRESTFCHELMHAVYFSMGRQEHDEREIDAIATFLHQFLLTQQGQA